MNTLYRFFMLACVLLAACARAPSPLSDFSEATTVTGRVLENTTACEVDGACYLRIQFADTVVTALYGAGERPAPECPITRAVSDAAFPLRPGEVVVVRVSTCPGEGYVLEAVGPWENGSGS